MINYYSIMVILAISAQIAAKYMHNDRMDLTELWLILILLALVDILKTLNKKQ